MSQIYSNEQESYTLSNNFTLERADNTTDFSAHWAAYRPNTEGFYQDWTERYSDLQHAPFRFWILQDTKRIGGALLRPNLIAEMFLIPPFDDIGLMITSLLPLVQQWSDSDRPIYGLYILPEHVSALETQGFTIKEQRTWMIRPTLAYDVTFDSGFEVSQPDTIQLDSYTDVFDAAFSGGVGAYGRRTRDDHHASLERLLADESYIAEASCVIIDAKSNQVATLCLVTETGGHGCINFVVTHPDYQERGLGKNAILYAIDKLYGNKLWVTLAVTVGNPAIHLYDALGFKRGTVISTLELA